MDLTRRYIMAHRTGAGSWTRPQIEALGLSWPPAKGWIDRVVGMQISNENRRIFESQISSNDQRLKKQRQLM